MKHLFISILLVFAIAVGQAQVKLSARVQYSQSANAKSKQLFLLDFWATWCGPCITASEYLGVLQEQFNNDLYILSISKEAKDLVAKSIQKNPSKLAVSIDYDAENFDKYNVHSLPYSVLLNADGEVVWKGNPTDLKNVDIKKYLKQNTQRIAIAKFLKYEQYKQVEEPKSVALDGNLKLEPIASPITEYPQTLRKKGVLQVDGTIQQLVAYLLGVSQLQVDYEGDAKKYRLSIKNSAPLTHKMICDKILEQLNMNIEEMLSEGEVLFVKSVNPAKFWNSVQYNWGKNNAQFMVDDNQFLADNILFTTMLGKLGDLCNKPVLLEKNIADIAEHDWQIHYRFTDLMFENLMDYGIEMEFVVKNYPSYFIKPKK